MNHLPSMVPFARIYFLAVGLVMIAGGIMGYVKAKSNASLVAGAVSGFLLILSAYLLPASQPVPLTESAHLRDGLLLALLVCLALAGRFVPALFRGKTMPAGYVAPLALIGVIIALWLLLHLPGWAPQ